MKGIVYKATAPNGKSYIGITITNLEERIRCHLKAVMKGSKFPFHSAIRKYGKDKIRWELIDKASSWEKLCKLERKYIKEFETYKNGYNLTLGGEGTFGLKHGPEFRLKDSLIRKQYFLNPENRIKQSIANKEAHKNNPAQAKQHSRFMKERYQKSSERGKTADGMRRYLSNKDNLLKHALVRGARAFLVYYGDKFVGEWIIQSQCAKDLGLSKAHINHCLYGERKIHKGYSFKFKEI